MAVDSYVEVLDQMVKLFKVYKPGEVTLENILRLCQTLNLESFIEDVGEGTERLSTASKIIVIDIDFDKMEGKVKQVKLVLASTYNSFNYYAPDATGNPNKEDNILLNSLVNFADLKQFQANLQFLYLLDTYSQLDMENGSSTTNGHGNNNNADSSANSTNPIGGGNSLSSTTKNGKLDLFKYYTELVEFLGQYFIDFNIQLEVTPNLNSIFGIYIHSGDQILAVIKLAKAKSPTTRLYEYVYSKETKRWINEFPENYVNGLSLVMEIQDKAVWFPREFLSEDIIFERLKDDDFVAPIVDVLINNTTEGVNGSISNRLFNTSQNISLLNDFTTKLINVTKFDISNDNLDLVAEIQKWILWYNTVLQRIVETLNRNSLRGGSLDVPNGAENNEDDLGNKHGGRLRRQSIVVGSTTVHKRRKSSNKNKRPSFTESTMLKEQGLQQFNLHDILTQPVIEENGMDASNEEALVIEGDDDDKMDICADDEQVPTAGTAMHQLVISEDHISLNGKINCSLYEPPENWKKFFRAFETWAS
ncbi:Med1p KNAG_0H00620 [Huiozyma naganishii CBS 8797]|uniref:Mediator of RNA polymerase II transcription subunit 1 n=1 Tax=Huiozyma naganishii (strain ATCC MYA-139 / BCRC 22969 / CBS 8797 / KCTC 17520 / NBRC 10181 / NCYC 3082 / Yp74L-3) TaxID=1071383 RepID=J7RP93_HUIN7|nr:hypothetical protein KNAG_0H00620 [Kazachstania naganishii CBS 8797]CCK71478.1 hypothetical protein KNAG_0H00620 [Kazachstania naganishii CBS 8797]